MRASWPFIVVLIFIGCVDAAAPAPTPLQARQINLLVVGDVGYNPADKKNTNQQTVANAMVDYLRGRPTRFDAVLMPGDIFKVKMTSTKDAAFQKGFEEMYDRSVFNMPFYPVLGNHDYDAPASAVELSYSSRFPESRWKMPARWYRIDLPAASPLVTVFMLDSNRDKMSSGDWKNQIKWLENELATPRAAAWTICCAHKPAFSDGQHGDSQTVQTQFGPLLKKYNVDFYFSGHDHVMEHTQPDGWKTSFVISGGGGENVERPVNGHKALFTQAVIGFAHFQADSRTARVRMINAKGSILHAFERTRAGEVRVLGNPGTD